jgi:hypothetical protein
MTTILPSRVPLKSEKKNLFQDFSCVKQTDVVSLITIKHLVKGNLYGKHNRKQSELGLAQNYNDRLKYQGNRTGVPGVHGIPLQRNGNIYVAHDSDGE